MSPPNDRLRLINRLYNRIDTQSLIPSSQILRKPKYDPQAPVVAYYGMNHETDSFAGTVPLPSLRLAGPTLNLSKARAVDEQSGDLGVDLASWVKTDGNALSHRQMPGSDTLDLTNVQTYVDVAIAPGSQENGGIVAEYQPRISLNSYKGCVVIVLNPEGKIVRTTNRLNTNYRTSDFCLEPKKGRLFKATEVSERELEEVYRLQGEQGLVHLANNSYAVLVIPISKPDPFKQLLIEGGSTPFWESDSSGVGQTKATFGFSSTGFARQSEGSSYTQRHVKVDHDKWAVGEHKPTLTFFSTLPIFLTEEDLESDKESQDQIKQQVIDAMRLKLKIQAASLEAIANRTNSSMSPKPTIDLARVKLFKPEYLESLRILNLVQRRLNR